MRVWLFLFCMLAALFCFSMLIGQSVVSGFNHAPSITSGQPLFIEKVLATLVSAILGLISVAYIYRAGEEVKKK